MSVWAEDATITPAEIEELRQRMKLDVPEFAALLELSRQHVGKLLAGTEPVVRGSTRVLLRWLLAAYGLDAGRTPHPRIPAVLVRSEIAALPWDDEPPLDAQLFAELRLKLGLSKKKDLAELLEYTYGHLYKLEAGPNVVGRGSLRVLLRWLYSLFDLNGGRTPSPAIPTVHLPSSPP